MNLSEKINAYRRDNNRVGIRNYVVILPVDDISNAACEAVANNIKGTIASKTKRSMERMKIFL